MVGNAVANLDLRAVEQLGQQQTVTLSCFRFDNAPAKAWAFSQMPLARRPLAALPGIGFFKLFGSGSGESFHPRPNFGVYAVMATWPTLEHAQRQLAEAAVFRRYRARACESLTLYLSATYARGLWDRGEPFEAQPGRGAPAPIGVLTRATIRRRKLLAFWKSVPTVSDAIARHHAPLFRLGLGEVPWLQQVTFSVWPSFESMRDFAYASGPHRDVIARVREDNWFREDLYARFALLGCEGRWTGSTLAQEVISR